MLNKYFKSKKAFTLVEFIIVMAIIGILVLLASPKFLDYVNKAKLTQIKNDVKVVENWNKAYYADNLKLPTDKEISYQSILIHINKLKNNDNINNNENKAVGTNSFVKTIYANNISQEFKTQLYFYDERGLITNTNLIEGDKFYLLDKEETIKNTNTKLKGFFITNNKGDVFYTDNKNYIKDKENIDLGLCRYEDLLQYKGKDYKIDDRGYITYFNKDNYVKQENGIFEVPGIINGTIVKGIADGTSSVNGSTMTFNGVFSGLDIKELKLPCTLEYIGSFAFAQNRIIKLNTNNTPNLKEIQEGAFQDNPIKELTVSENIEFLGKNSFYNSKDPDNKGLNITINKPDSQTIIGSSNTKDNHNLIIHKDAFGKNNITSNNNNQINTINSKEPNYKPNYNITTNKNNTVSISNYTGNKKKVVIPNTINGKIVTEIKDNTFKGKGIEEIVLPSGLQKIGDYAFAFNILKEVNIPKNINSVGNYAFAYNTDLIDFTKPTIQKSIIIEDIVKYNDGIDKETGNINKKLNIEKEIIFKEGIFKICDKDSNIIDLEDLNFNNKNEDNNKDNNKDKDENIKPALDEDFKFIKDSSGYDTVKDGKGYYRYIGKEEVVKIPKEINGTNITSAYRMFEKSNLTNLKVIDNGQLTNTSYMFLKSSNLTNLDLSNFNTENIIDMSDMFSNCSNLINLDLSNFNTNNVIKMSSMFYKCSSLKNLDLSNFNTSNVTNMRCMFYSCSSLKILDLSNFNTSNVTKMGAMFSNCSELEDLNLSSFNTEKVTSMSTMFDGCSSLTNLDLSSFNTSNVTNMTYMFYNCNRLTNLDLSNFNTSKVTNMRSMFYNCISLKELDLSSFNTFNVTDMEWMFSYCRSLKSLDLSNFNTSKVTDMYKMFYDCSSLEKLNLSNFNTFNVTDMDEMFYNCNKLQSGIARNQTEANKFNKLLGRKVF